MNKSIVVTYRASEVEQARFEAILGGEAPLIYLAEIPASHRNQALEEAFVLLAWNFPQEIGQEDYPSLKQVALIQLVTAGVDHVPFAHLPAKMIVASNAGAYAAPMAEHVVAMTLALAKRLLAEQKKMQNGLFDDETHNRSLKGLTAGILGFGGAGRATARLMRAFGMHIYAINSSGKSPETVDFIGTVRELEYVLRESDVVVLTLPLSRATKGLIGQKELSWMKPDAVLINVARGALVDEEALYQHLKEHPSFSAGIDTWWEEPLRGGPFRMKYPFLDLSNVLGSPHNSALVPEVIGTAAEQAAANVKRFLDGEQITGVVPREAYL